MLFPPTGGGDAAPPVCVSERIEGEVCSFEEDPACLSFSAGSSRRLQTQATYLAASTHPGSEEALMKFSREIAPVLI